MPHNAAIEQEHHAGIGFSSVGPQATWRICAAGRARNRQMLDYWLIPRAVAAACRAGPILTPLRFRPAAAYHDDRDELRAVPACSYRLVGTAIVDFAKFDFTGQYADELQFRMRTASTMPAATPRWRRRNHRAWAFRIGWCMGNVVRWIRVHHLPAGNDDQLVTQCIATEDYETDSPVIEAGFDHPGRSVRRRAAAR